MQPESLTAQIPCDISCVFIAKPTFLCFLLAQTASLPRLGVIPCCKEKFTCLTFYRKKKGVWEEVPELPTQACWDHWALTSASSSKIYSDLPVFSSFLSVKENLDSWSVWSAIADPFVIFTLLSCVIHKIFYAKLKEISAANVTKSVLYRVPKPASHERPRTRVAWRKIKPEW